VARRAQAGLVDEQQHGEWAYRDIPGFSKATTIEAIGKHGYVLTPGSYVGAEVQEDDGEPFAEAYQELLAEVEACLAEDERLASVVRERLANVSVFRSLYEHGTSC